MTPHHVTLSFAVCAFAVISWTCGFFCGYLTTFLIAAWIKLKDWLE